jgi:hypothetical protein
MLTAAPDLAPLEWTPWLTDPERLDARRGDERLTVTQTDERAWTWVVERTLSTDGEGCTVRACGEAASLAEAQHAAAGHRWDRVTLVHDHPTGQDTVWLSGDTRLPNPDQRTWTACLAGDRAQIHLSGVRREMDRPWYWSRQCTAAAELLALCGDRLHGYAESRELAMIAAIEAPDQLRRAAAAFLAQWRADRELIR